MQGKSNKKLYSEELFKVWSEKKTLLPLEDYFIKKYLTNLNGNVVEAGTGGGRIIFEIENLNFINLDAFDYVEKMISFCNEKKKAVNSSIIFKVADVTNLEIYKTNTFDYLIYLQQVLCFIDKENLPKALNEANRIGNNNSLYLFSFLNWNAKYYNPLLSLLVNFIRILRGEKANKYKLPWLKINEKFNWSFLNKNQPQTTWHKEKHIIKTLEKNGFSVIESKSKIKASGKLCHLHIACRKNNIF